MSSHHGQHRSRHSRSRMHHSSSSSSHYQSTSSHSRSRNSSSNVIGNSGTSRSGGHHQQQSHHESSKSLGGYWSEHQSSSGKVYYYNTKTGVSQWEIPAELKQHQQQQQQHQQQHQQQQQLKQEQHHHHHHHQQQQQHQRQLSPESEISESSSIKHQQDKSPSSSAVSSHSAHSDSVPNDKPLLTPSLAQYFKPELIVNFNSSHIEDLERQANQYSRDALILSERILKESVDLKIAKAVVHYVEISLEAQEKKYSILKATINNFGFA